MLRLRFSVVDLFGMGITMEIAYFLSDFIIFMIY